MIALIGQWSAAPESAPLFSYATGSTLALIGAGIGVWYLVRNRRIAP